jgi:hypothetical protein
MLGDLNQQVGIHIDARHSPGIIIQDDREGTAVRDIHKVLVNGIFVHQATEIRGREQEHVFSSGRLGFFDQVDGSTDRAFCGTDDDGNLCEAGRVERFAGGSRHGGFLCWGEVHGFAVGTHGDEADKPGFGEAYRVSFDGRDVEVFGFGVEEGHCWGVDAGNEGPACARVTVGGNAIDAVCVGHDCCYILAVEAIVWVMEIGKRMEYISRKEVEGGVKWGRNKLNIRRHSIQRKMVGREGKVFKCGLQPGHWHFCIRISKPCLDLRNFPESVREMRVE